MKHFLRSVLLIVLIPGNLLFAQKTDSLRKKPAHTLDMYSTGFWNGSALYNGAAFEAGVGIGAGYKFRFIGFDIGLIRGVTNRKQFVEEVFARFSLEFGKHSIGCRTAKYGTTIINLIESDEYAHGYRTGYSYRYRLNEGISLNAMFIRDRSTHSYAGPEFIDSLNEGHRTTDYYSSKTWRLTVGIGVHRMSAKGYYLDCILMAGIDYLDYVITRNYATSVYSTGGWYAGQTLVYHHQVFFIRDVRDPKYGFCWNIEVKAGYKLNFNRKSKAERKTKKDARRMHPSG